MPLHFDFVLGVPGAMAPTARNLVHLVERIARLGRELGRPPATPAEARQILGLPPV